MPRYLITTLTGEPFLTDYFIAENCFNADLEMIVYDLYEEKYTLNGIIWMDIERDHL